MLGSRNNTFFKIKRELDNLYYDMDVLISMALLYVTQQTPIYGSNSNDWEII